LKNFKILDTLFVSPSTSGIEKKRKQIRDVSRQPEQSRAVKITLRFAIPNKQYFFRSYRSQPEFVLLFKKELERKESNLHLI